MYKVKLLNEISSYGLDRFDENYEYNKDMENEDAILVRSASLHEYPLHPSLKAIARAGAGVNNIPIDKCSEEGIVVFNTPGANANAVKELVLCSLFLSSRKIIEGIHWVQDQKGDKEVGSKAEKQKSQYVGPEIEGKKLGVIGLGAIGVKVANSAIDLGMEVWGYDPFLSLSAAWGMSRYVKPATTLDVIFKECDYITLHVPSTKETKGFMNKESFEKMVDGVCILNFARGDLVNNQDLIEALTCNKVGKYISDFACAELIGVENVVLLPHLGASTPESEDNCAKMAVKEIREYLENGNITNSVNFPEVVQPRETTQRMCVINKNVPNILATISTVFASHNMNIENMVNKAKGEYAYTLIDTNEEITQEVIDHITLVEGIVNVRVIK
ncbi:phosphoglycerate dehydrogenase [Tannockella kyphosi]|uniref:phosphoglycerate dehydrogenase n=1 Tax=Tannockella kyphosi TaxID=2899121 RepID=UPI002012D591|nr:phosphoglycerate dehydrogenase [Tannockella kyphosi]